MNKRQEELQGLQHYLQQVNKEVTMVLQSLQWDRKHLFEGDNMVQCSVDTKHRVPYHNKHEHEKECSLKSQGYHHGPMLPDPVDPSAPSVVKFGTDEIKNIILSAHLQPNIGPDTGGTEPLSLDRLQATYTWQERRAIYEAVVQRAPQCGDLSELPLLSGAEHKAGGSKSWLELMAQQRDLKRRPAKYRSGGKTGNYSHVLRDVIATQMEMYAEVNSEKTRETQPINKSTHDKRSRSDNVGHVEIKQEYDEGTAYTDAQRHHDARNAIERNHQKHRSKYEPTNDRERSKSKYRDERNLHNVIKYDKQHIDKYADSSNKSHRSSHDRRSENTKSEFSRRDVRHDFHRKDKIKHEDREGRYKSKDIVEPSTSSNGRSKDKYERHYDEHDDRSYRKYERHIKKEPGEGSSDDDDDYKIQGSKRKKETHKERDRSERRTEKERHYREKYGSEKFDSNSEKRREKNRRYEK